MRQRMNDFDPAEKDFMSRLKVHSCPALNVISAAHEGVLPEEQSDAVHLHVEHCEICRRLVDDLDSIDFGEPSTSESDRIRRRINCGASGTFWRDSSCWIRHNWWAPAIALAACAAVLVVLFRPSQPEHIARTTQIAQAKPVPDIPLEKLPIRVSPTALLATRGASNSIQAPGSDLARALASYQAEDFARAAQQLKSLSGAYPKDGTVRLYLGVSELFLDRNQEAANDLANASGVLEGGRLIDAQWYLALANLRIKNPEAALPLLQQLCDRQSAYKDQSCKLASQLR